MAFSAIGKVPGVKPLKKPVASIGAPANLAPPPAPAYAPPVPTYTGDSTFFATLAHIGANRDTQSSQIIQDQADDTQNTQKYQKQLGERSMDSQSSTMANAAKMGLADSGANAKSVADIIKNTTTQQLAADDAWRQRSNARNTSLNSITATMGTGTDYGTQGAQAYGEGEQRMLGNYTPPGAVMPSTASGNAAYPLRNTKTGEAYKSQVIAGKTVHIYPDGRKVVVG